MWKKIKLSKIKVFLAFSEIGNLLQNANFAKKHKNNTHGR